MDFLIKHLNTIVEVKYASDKLKDAKLGDELIQDIGRYQSRTDVDKIVFFVYDKFKVIKNPNGMINDLIEIYNKKSLEVIFSPKY